uniref:Fibronectin type-III domain-containing protein n=1 Tax=Poecilia mexicana TaxID=48701 RepID=A0A3B3Y3I3_9TELE
CAGLLDPPSIVSLQPEDTVGKMLVSLGRNLKHLWMKSKYRIHYSSKTLGEKTVEVKDDSFLLSLEPGEEVEVQASVKCANRPDEHPGYWSAWSKPVRAIVPQSAGVSDRKQTINKNMVLLIFSQPMFIRKVRFLYNLIHLKGKLINDKLCLEWEAPLPSLSNHMKYEVNVQIKGVEEYTMTKPGDTSMCVSLSSGSQFSVRVRAQPDGSIYSGYWSDWSDVLSVIIIIILIMIMKLKLLFWPPVPNLEKVLQGFLTDINQQKWNPPVTSKLCFEETTSSVVEIMSDELPVLDNPSEELNFLSSDGSFSFEEQADGSSGSETLRDYVTLNKDLSILCLKQNCYVYEQFKDGKDPEKGDNLSTTCHCLKPCSCSNYFNHSYLPLSQSTDGLNKNINVGHDKSNPYTNLFLD